MDDRTRTQGPNPRPGSDTFPTAAADLARDLNLPLDDTRDPAGTLAQSPEEQARAAAASDVVTVPGYDVLGELGRGGMGVVYKARQHGLNRLVALKMVIAGPYASPSTRARFLLEAESVAALEHPHVVRVFAFGEHAGHPFLAMEFLPGGTLADRVKANGPLPPREAAEVVAKLAAAVAHAHAKGVVHRDIKPGNVLLTADGEPRLTDFGLAKVGRSDMTATGAVLGTPAYMSPEQAAGRTKEVGASSDVYSLGAVLFDLLTGKPPFSGDSVAVTLQKVMNEPAVAPRKHAPAIPRDLDTICLKCLEKSPADRYPTADALADDLRRFVAGEPILARPAGRVERTLRWAKRRRVGIALAVVAVMLQSGIALGLYHAMAPAQVEQRPSTDLPVAAPPSAVPDSGITNAPEHTIDAATAASGLLAPEPRDEGVSIDTGPYRALVVGCDDYSGFGQGVSLSGVPHDVLRLVALLGSSLQPSSHAVLPSNSVRFLMGAVTKRQIASAFDRLANTAIKGDQVVIVLLGNSTSVPREGGSELVFVPCPPKKSRDSAVQLPIAVERGSAITPDELDHWMKAITDKGAFVCVIIDVAGGAAADSRFTGNNNPNVTVLHSCRPSESSWETRSGGIFTEVLCRVLGQAETPMTYPELVEAITPDVDSKAKEVGNGQGMTPWISGGNKNALVFGGCTWKVPELPFFQRLMKEIISLEFKRSSGVDPTGPRATVR